MTEHTAIQKRLLIALPNKVNKPLMQLLKVEHISEEIISDVLDMVDLGGRPEHALGYVVSYQHLTKSGVPMKDIIAMTKTYTRRLNPSWSRTRWMEEHRKLGRVAVLVALSGDDYIYELDEYNRLLPVIFPGYLIKSSRRLGAEGLRQDHCVASYDKRIRSGACCIAVVFIKKERWTVELVISGDSLRIRQIKTKHNRTPSNDERDVIFGCLGVETPKPVTVDADEAITERDAIRTNLLTICNRLRMLGISDVTASFDGGGDSGCVYEPEAHRGDGVAVDQKTEFADIEIRYIRIDKSYDIQMQNWNISNREVTVSLKDALQETIEAHIDLANVDWHNNDGGFGEYVLNVAEMTYDLQINVYHTESESAHFVEGDPIDEM